MNGPVTASQIKASKRPIIIIIIITNVNTIPPEPSILYIQMEVKIVVEMTEVVA